MEPRNINSKRQTIILPCMFLSTNIQSFLKWKESGHWWAEYFLKMLNGSSPQETIDIDKEIRISELDILSSS